MDKNSYLAIRKKVFELGYKENEYDWAMNNKKTDNNWHFFREYVWVVCNSGMKNQIAEKIFIKIMDAIDNQIDISEVFNHKHKVKSIKYVLDNLNSIFEKYTSMDIEDRDTFLEFCESMPHIGKITKYHLAKNWGCDIAKPDRHLERIANTYGMNTFELCDKLSKETGDKVSAIDVVLWRGANLGII